MHSEDMSDGFLKILRRYFFKQNPKHSSCSCMAKCYRWDFDIQYV